MQLSRSTLYLACAAALAMQSASAQTVRHYWDFANTTEQVGGLVTTMIGTPDLSQHATYGEAYPGSGASLNTVLNGLNGGGGYLEAEVHNGSPTALDFGTADFCLSYWVYDEDEGDLRGARVFDFLDATSTGCQLGTNGNSEFNCRIDDDAGNSLVTPPPAMVLPKDVWQHIVINVDRTNDNVEIFVDGVSVANVSSTAVTGNIFPTHDLRLGVINNGNDGSGAQNSAIDDFAFYDDLLSASDAAGLAAGTLTPLDFTGGGLIGSSFCGPANLNSSGMPGLLTAFGSDTAANNDVRLDATQMALNQWGMFINSMTQGFVNPPGSQGNLCLSGAIGRYNTNIMNTGPTGEFALQLDLNNTPTPGGPVAIQAGESWYFQAWFRDNNPGSTSNFTDGVGITFQ